LTNAASGAFAISAAAAAKVVFLQQPSSASAGTAISPAVTVVVEDTFGNTVTSDTSTVTLTLSHGTFASGATSVTASAVNGVATFSNLVVDTAGNYTLAASDGGLSGATSGSFTVNPAAAAELAFFQQPSNASAGTPDAPAVTVAVEDAFGNTVTNDASMVTLTLSHGTFANGATSATASDVNGVATFSNLVVDTAGSYSLTASDGSLTNAASGAFAISAAAAAKVVFLQQPSSASAGTAISPAVTVVVEDTFGNTVTSDTSTVTLTLSHGTFASGATSVTASAVNGIATFSNLVVDTAGSYTLAASDGSLTNAASGAFTINPAAATKLVFFQQPSNASAGTTVSPAVTMAVEDAFGNTVTSDASTVTLTLSHGTFANGATTATASAVDGVATFSNLVVDTAGSYTLTATDGSLTNAASGAFAISAAAAAKVVLLQQPTSASAGTAISPAVTVVVEDTFGNTVTNNASTVTLTLSHGTFASGATSVTASAVNGVATFSNLVIDAAGSYALTASDGSLTGSTSGSFAISAAAAAELAFLQQPSNASAGIPDAPAVTVAVEDAFGNTVTSNASTVTLTLSHGAFASGNTVTASAVNGVATFSNLVVDTTGSYALTASDGSLTGAASGSFAIGAAAAAKVVFLQQPSSASAGTAISPAVTVVVEDTFGNTVTSDTSTVTLTLSHGTFASGATSVTASAVNGIATFSNLIINAVGSYTLTASDGSLTGAASGSFTINPAAAAKLVFSQQPSNASAGAAISPVTVVVEDTFGNTVTGNTSTVTLTLNHGTFANGATSVTASAVNGVATFGNLVINAAGSYTLTASDGSLSGATSGSFTINPTAAAKVTFLRQPSNASAGTAVSPAVTVVVQDTFGNTVTSDVSTVTLTLSHGTFANGATSVTASAVNGIATFSNLIINATGSYTLTVSDGSLTGSTSGSFAISAAAAAKVVFLQPPTSASAGTAISPAVTVVVEDAFGNTVTSDASTVTLTLSRGAYANGATSVTASAVNGVATFGNLVINAAGSYTLTASEGSLTAAASSSITIFPVTVTTVDDSDQGTDQNDFNYVGSWKHVHTGNVDAYDHTESYTNTANDTVTISFTGTQVKLYVDQQNNLGIAAVSIDGGPETYIDEYAATAAGDVLVYTSPVLTAGPHTLEVRSTGTHNAASLGARINIDRVDIIMSGPEVSLTGYFNQVGIVHDGTQFQGGLDQGSDGNNGNGQGGSNGCGGGNNGNDQGDFDDQGEGNNGNCQGNSNGQGNNGNCQGDPDQQGAALSANLLGTSVYWMGTTFLIGTTNDNVVAAEGQTISLPAGGFSRLQFLATAVDGNQPNQRFTVTYTDGTTQTFNQSVSDWTTPQNYAGESNVVNMAYSDLSNGAKDNQPVNVYGYNFALNPAKTVKSITLPDNDNVKILAISLT
jgi:hypothetical protein